MRRDKSSHSFICSFKKLFLSVCYARGTAVGVRDMGKPMADILTLLQDL